MPLTYCNPLSLPDYQRAKACFAKADWELGWVHATRRDFREMADPTVIYFENRWYLFPSAGMLWHSADFVNWERQAIEPFDIGYAPTVVLWKGWLLLTACGRKMWRARHPLGPWESIGPVRDDSNTPIDWNDPALFVDDDGALYCYHGLGIDGIYAVRLRDDDPARWASPRVHCFAFDPSHVWERHGERNENPAKSYIEGAWMTRHAGKYYLQYSGPGTEWKCYAVGCYTSDTPLGPWTYQPRNPILLAPPGSFVNGCGHHSLVAGPNNTLWCFYTTLVRIEHWFERRIGMDPAGFDEQGNLFVAGPTQTPQLAPGTARDPLASNDAGLLAVSINRFVTASSHAAGHEPTYAVDDEIRTWWEADVADSEPWLMIDLDCEWMISASRLLFADRRLDYGAGILPGPYQYVIETSHDSKTWSVMLDQRQNAIDRHIAYETWTPQPARYVRLRVVGWPSRLRVGVWEWTIFGAVP